MPTNRYILAAKRIRKSVVPLIALLAFFIFVSWFIIKPLAMPLIWSILFSYFAYPLFKFLYIRVFGSRFRNLAAAVSTGVILIFIALPLLMLSVFLTRESIRISKQLMDSGILSSSFQDIAKTLEDVPVVGGVLGELDLLSEAPIVDALIKDGASYAASLLTTASGHVFESLMKLLLIILIVAITSFFLVRDGKQMIEFTTDILPLSEKGREGFVRRTAVMLRAVVCGVIMTAAVQGALGCFGWWFVGLSHPVFFGCCMFMTAMIPFVGTPAIWLPGAAALFFQGNASGAVLLLIWGILVVSSIDNFIKPIFISEGSKIHMLVIFIGLFGGLYAWGFLGVFVGPLTLSLALYLLEIYHDIVRQPDEARNADAANIAEDIKELEKLVAGDD